MSKLKNMDQGHPFIIGRYLFIIPLSGFPKQIVQKPVLQ